MNEGQGSISYSGPQTAGGGGGVTFAGARNGTSQDTGNFVVLGNDAGDATNPAAFTSNREIAFNGKSLGFIDLLNTSAIQSRVDFFLPTFPFGITQKGNGLITPGNSGYFNFWQPANYGQVYADPSVPGGNIRMDRWYINYQLADNNQGVGIGMPDAVFNIGYNINASNGRLNTLDGAWRFAMEGNFEIGVSGLFFEFHVPEITLFNGTIFRTNSYYANKTTGFTFNQKFVDSNEFFSVSDSLIYAQILCSNAGGNFGTLNLYSNVAASSYGAINWNTAGMSINFTPLQTGLSVQVPVHGSTSTFKTDGSLWLNCNQTGLSTEGVGTTFIGLNGVYGTPDPSAILDVYSVVRGFLPPRMSTAQKNAIPAPAAGLLVYDTTLNKLCVRTAAAWETVTSV